MGTKGYPSTYYFRISGACEKEREEGREKGRKDEIKT